MDVLCARGEVAYNYRGRLLRETEGKNMTETPREINRRDYAGRQQQILDALALLDDLAQDASDLGQTELSTRLHAAYGDVERFRIIQGRKA